MKSLGYILLGLAILALVLLFSFWGLNVWTADDRWGQMAFVMFYLAVVAGFGGGMLASRE